MVLAILIGVTLSLVANLATTVYLHRALAHRALMLRPPAEHEIDPGWWLIKILTWMRLARLRVMTGAARRSAQM